MNIQSLSWPVVLKLPQQDELIYLESMECYQAQLGLLGKLDSGIVIDRHGTSYQINNPDKAQFLQRCTPQIPLNTLLDWTRQHASLAGQCCVSKLKANNIQSLFEIIEFIEQER
ncbi:DUF4144 domain-containing protein [Shewanella sp. MBTL60-007]|uniref:DUF4144 domain-containing protein n=1 Tax=Shewanella sp. MBTL60-007 TaxID=2815911 RepID=UPI001BBB2C6A|nr:DUF4144 domain-containing protein [Shewanella sp. MBTL60-007]GIU16358.1 hypothetical protein TUM3792_09980 [Shewanella sp. MBTL60-007]